MTQAAQLGRPDPSAPAPIQPANRPILSRKAKAAIVVQYLVNEGADVPLSDLPDSLQAQLTQQLGKMRYISRDTLHAVMREFAEELDSVGLSFPYGMQQAMDSLQGKISDGAARSVRQSMGFDVSDDPWVAINEMPIENLKSLLFSESIEVCAVVLSKLEITKAAEFVSSLPGDRARAVSLAVSRTQDITPDTVRRIGQTLMAEAQKERPRAFARDPGARLGDILNITKNDTRSSLLSGIEEMDRDFAEEVRQSIFTFAHIAERLDPMDASKNTRDVEAERLIVALAGAKSDADRQSVDFILSNLSKRMSESIREEMVDLGTPSEEETEQAQMLVVAAIKQMANRGEIKFRAVET